MPGRERIHRSNDTFANALSEVFQAMGRKEKARLELIEVLIEHDVHAYFHIRGTSSILHMQGYPGFCDPETMAISASILDKGKFTQLRAPTRLPLGNEHDTVTRWIYPEIEMVKMTEGETTIGGMLRKAIPELAQNLPVV